jgi:hypothetical protein
MNWQFCYQVRIARQESWKPTRVRAHVFLHTVLRHEILRIALQYIDGRPWYVQPQSFRAPWAGLVALCRWQSFPDQSGNIVWGGSRARTGDIERGCLNKSMSYFSYPKWTESIKEANKSTQYQMPSTQYIWEYVCLRKRKKLICTWNLNLAKKRKRYSRTSL